MFMILQGFAAVVLSTACAQSGGNLAPVVRARPSVVSVDVLRHPLPPKVRQLLIRAMVRMDAGDHEAAIEQLRETLRKYPDSAAFVYELLAVEYAKVERFQEAVSAFEQAVSFLPHDSMTHYNFGLALISTGDRERAEQEFQRAVELDPKNPKMRVLSAQLAQKRAHN